MDPTPGATIAGRYVVEATLGKGGMGEVYRVFDRRSARRVALKRTKASEKPGALPHFALEREFHALSQLAHPRIIEVYDYGVEESGPYYTMELLEGDDLQRMKGLDHRIACALLRDVASSLAILHSRRLVHRDVTHRNVRCTADGHAKLIDFGAMVSMGVAEQIVGTPPFIAPESLYMLPLDGRADLFSLGALAYWLFTGAHAFPASNLAALPELWLVRPSAPSRRNPALPAELDELVLALLSPEVLGRPASAAEVIARIEAVAELAPAESLEVAQAYLTTPALVGRDRELAQLRNRVSRAVAGSGGAISIESGPGIGRTRLLHQAVLEGRMAGGLVLRAKPLPEQKNRFSLARALLSQLLDELASGEAAGQAGLHALTERVISNIDRCDEAEGGGVQDLFIELLEAVAEQRPLVVAIDELERCDPDSAGALAKLAHGASDRRMLILVALSTSVEPAAPGAVRFLSELSTRLRLKALGPFETESLLRSMFGDADVRAVSEWTYAMSQGNPREIFDLAQYLLGTKIARYAGGVWSLPGKLDDLALPESGEQAFSAALAALSASARGLAEALALSTEQQPLEVEDYRLFVGESGAVPGREQVFAALKELVAAHVLLEQRGRYAFPHQSFRERLVRQVSEGRRRELHARLAEVFAHRGADRDVVAYHLQEAGDDERAFEMVTALITEPRALERLLKGAKPIVPLALFALRHGERSGRSPRQLFELRQILVALATTVDPDLARYAAPNLEQLRRDTGLVFWDQLDQSCPEGERIQRCLQLAYAAYQDAPESERCLEPFEAIRELAQFLSPLIGVYARTWEVEKVPAVAQLLGPFRTISPVLALVHEILAISVDAMTKGSAVADRRRAVFEALRDPGLQMDENTRLVTRLQFLYYLGVEESQQRPDRVAEIADELSAYPLYEPLSWQICLLASVHQGDVREAARCRKQRELSLLGSAAFASHISVGIHYEAAGHALIGDLMALGRTKESILAEAERYPGWRIFASLVGADYDRLRGKTQAALEQYQGLLERIQPGEHLAWPRARAGYAGALLQSRQYERAHQVAEESLLAIDGFEPRFADLIPLKVTAALARAKLGEVDVSAAELDRAIAVAEAAEVRGILLFTLYEARARVALAGSDSAGFDDFSQRVTAIVQASQNPALIARAERLLSDRDNRQAGAISIAPGSIHAAGESSLAAMKQTLATRLGHCSSAQARAAQALALLIEESGATGGALYLVRQGTLELSAARSPAPPELKQALSDYLAGYLDEATRTGSEADLEPLVKTSFADGRGNRYQLLMLGAGATDEPQITGGVALCFGAGSPLRLDHALLRAVSDYLLEQGDATFLTRV